MTMDEITNLSLPTPRRIPWNKGKLTGAKPPLRQKHVWAIRTKLQIEQRVRDLAMFNLAIDSKLRGCDVVALQVEDVAPNGYSVDRATVRQKKTGRPVRFELTEQTRQAVDAYLRTADKKTGEFLFTGLLGRCMTTRQYARLLSGWIASIGLDPHLFGTHSLTATCARYSSCSATPRSRAQCGILASRLMTLFPLRNRSTSELNRAERFCSARPPRCQSEPRGLCR
jgi:integrase